MCLLGWAKQCNVTYQQEKKHRHTNELTYTSNAPTRMRHDAEPRFQNCNNNRHVGAMPAQEKQNQTHTATAGSKYGKISHYHKSFLFSIASCTENRLSSSCRLTRQRPISFFTDRHPEEPYKSTCQNGTPDAEMVQIFTGVCHTYRTLMNEKMMREYEISRNSRNVGKISMNFRERDECVGIVSAAHTIVLRGGDPSGVWVWIVQTISWNMTSQVTKKTKRPTITTHRTCPCP